MTQNTLASPSPAHSTAVASTAASPHVPGPREDFLFDLRGYLVLEGALDSGLLERLNAEFDLFPADLPMGGWYRNSQRRDYTPDTGLELHQAYELGEPFEELIDHPAWINYVRRYCGEAEAYTQGLYIDECLASVRTQGGHHPVHSGGYKGALRGRYLYEHGVFRCGQVNIICALTDIGPGDGPTMVIPGSHKSNFPHPGQGDYGRGDRMDHLEGAVPVHLKAGDALLFVDGLMHGGSSRTNPGERRITIYRYGPIWGAQRFGYQPSAELLARLTPERRRIVQPVMPLAPGEERMAQMQW